MSIGVEMYKYLIVLIICFLFGQNCFADCYTGFACNLQQIEKEEIKNYQNFINLINKYFEKRYIEKDYITDKFKINSYNEIFSFNTIL